MIVRNGKRLGSILHKDTRVLMRTEPSPAEAKPKPPTKAELQAQAEALGLSTEGTKAEIEARIAEAGAAEEVSGDGDEPVRG